jgi:hypothetical protein
MDCEAGLSAHLESLRLEYTTLRSEITARIPSRYQFLGFFAASTAILVTAFVQAKGDKAVIPLVIGTFLIVLGLQQYFVAQRSLGKLSDRIVKLEQDINRIIRGLPGAPEDQALHWESHSQWKRSWLMQAQHGPGQVRSDLVLGSSKLGWDKTGRDLRRRRTCPEVTDGGCPTNRGKTNVVDIDDPLPVNAIT